MALVLLQGSVIATEDTATRVQSGELKGLAALGEMLGVGALVQAVDTSLVEGPPTPVLWATWTDARAITADLRVSASALVR